MIKEQKRSKGQPNEQFSILIPTWNNLPFLQLCIRSILNNSAYKHQIIVHVNDGEDGTLNWVRTQENLCYTYSEENIGVCYPLNAMRNLARTNYLVFVNDDMYLCPNWDTYLLKAINHRNDDLFFFSGTLIEPTFSNNNCAIAPKNYGGSPADFDEVKLLAEIDSISKKDWAGATWPPNVVSTRMWDLVGGYSTEFSPGMYSDPDFSKKLWNAGVRDFRGIGASKAYHFMSKSVGRVVRNDGRTQFLKKWGLSSSTFMTFFLRRGQDYTGPLTEPNITNALKMKILFSKIKRIFSA